jgi:ubiquinol-cytochrome c reductase cytochrome b subunit
LIFLPLLKKQKKIQGKQFSFKRQIFFWVLVNVFFLLTWIGARPVERPFELIGQFLTIIYFILYLF